MDNLLGTEIKGYALRELIGTGGFGAVYLANQPVVGREVAIKVILPEYANAPMFVRRFETEARLVARLEHPYIVPLYDYWRDPKGAYLVMRYLRGGNLTRLLRRDGPLSLENAGLMLNQIASALAVAHANGVVHRDLKPDNILLDEAGNYYLTDFGIAKDIGSEGINLTQTGTIIGSPAYLSPEQITGEEITPLSDVYSLGILLHYALTGEHPFPGKTPTAMLIHQVQDAMPPLKKSRDDVDGALEDVLQRATAKDPGSRYSSVMDLALAFNRALRDSDTPTAEMRRMAADGQLVITGMSPIEVQNPYKGLKAFEEADADQFYGREHLTQRLLERLTPQHDDDEGDSLLVVVGPSGSGKSSVVKAGLIPQLRRGAIEGNDVIPSSSEWFYVEMVPGGEPMEELEAALLRIAVNPPESLLHQLESDTRGLTRAIKRVLPDDHSQLLLFIDQFEEVFTLTEDESKRQHFLNSLLTALNEPRNHLRLVITLRADFYDRPLSYYEFGERVREHTEVVLPLNAQELDGAIVRPARQVGVMLEQGLAAAIIADVREQPGALPLLQYALTQLFERRDGSRLTLKAYNDIGGAMGALARRAEELYQSLDMEEKDAARQLFLRLVTLGEGKEDTRRRISRSELTALGDTEAMDDVIETFGKQRLLTFDNDPQTREPTLEVAHEALIREWRRLRDWLDSAREDLRTQRRLHQAAIEWLVAGKDASYLATGTRLDQFEALQQADIIAMNDDEATYLHESLAQRDAREQAERERLEREEALEQRARHRMRLLLGVVSVAAVVATALAILSGVLFRRSQDNLALAQVNARESQAVALAANARSLIDDYRPALGLRLALEAAAQVEDLIPVQQALAETTYAPGALAQINPFEEASLISMSFNGDGTRLAAGSSDGRVIFVDVFENKVLHEVEAHFTTNADNRVTGMPVQAVACSSAQLLVASTGTDGVIKLWDAETGEERGEIAAHETAVNALAFSPDGTRLLSGGADGTLYLWNVETGERVRTFEGSAGDILSVDFSADGARVIASTGDPEDGQDRVARVWDAETGELVAALQAEGTGWLRAAVLSPDGALAAVASYDPNEFGGTIRIWDVDSQRVLRRLTGHTDVITTLDIAPDGETLLSGSWDRSVRRWNIATGEEVQRFDMHADRILHVEFSPDGHHAVTSSGRADSISIDNSTFFVGLQQLDLVERLEGHENWLWTAAYSPDGDMIATGSGDLNVAAGDNSVRLWDADTGENIAVLEAHTNTVTGVDFHPTQPLLASSSGDGLALLWNLETLEIERRFEGHEGAVNNVDFSPDGSLLLTTGSDGTLRLWDVETGDMLRMIEAAHDGRVFRARFSPDGLTFVSGGSDSLVKLWDAETGDMLHVMRGHGGWVNTVNFSPDGSQIVSGADNDLILWNAATGEEIGQLVGHQGFVYGGAFSPDGVYILSGASDTTVRLWEAATGAEIRRFEGHTNWVLDVSFSPDGTRAVSAAEDNTARVWRIARSTEELIAWAQANRYVPELTCGERAQYNVEPLCEGYTSADIFGRVGR